MKFRRTLLALAVGLVIQSSSGLTATQRLLATVNDQPVTSGDVDQYLALQKLLGIRDRGRKQATEDLINQVVKIEEAKLIKMNASDREIEARIGEIAKALKTDKVGIESKLKKQGIGIRLMRQFVASQIGFARLLRFKYKAEYKVDEREVDRRLEEINGKIRQAKSQRDRDVNAYLGQFKKLKAVSVYSLMEVNFPLDAADGQATDELLQARALDAVQYGQRFKSCKGARSAASGIFNVRVGKQFEADASKLPPELSKLLRSKGPGGIIGPMRSQNGLQMIAFCGQRRIDPPKPKKIPEFNVQAPSRAQIANVVEAEGFEKFEKKFVSDMRKRMIIEYKDPSLSQ
jgi:peptidyl-prolyl cis-trans isomerase SurA